jgi:tRNA threonylcarbamoyladenosine biosynthesis protein TsaB
MLTLALETSGPLGSVAVLESGRVLKAQTLELGRQHGQSLIPTIRDVLADCGKTAKDCDLVAVDVGPGSYTGVRVGVVCAKTLAYAVGCRLVALDSLHTVACNSPPDVSRVEVICDAQRGDLFTATFDRTAQGDWVSQGSIQIVTVEAWSAGLNSQSIVSGPGLERITPQISDRCRVLGPEFRVPQAVWIAHLAIQAVETGAATDLWSVEPLYLRRSSAEVQWDKLHPGGKKMTKFK